MIALEEVPALAVRERVWFGGTPDLRRIDDALGSTEVRVVAASFSAGGRALPHTHVCDQLLYFPSQAGVVAVNGGEDHLVPSGTFVLLPAGLPHMHGATPEGPTLHISFMLEDRGDFDCPIPTSWAQWRPAP